MLVTESGIIIEEARFEHPSKAPSPILVTESGIIIEVIPLQLKAKLPILTTELPKLLF